MDYFGLCKPEEGDLCIRELRPDRFEVSVYDGKKDEWRDQAVVSLSEVNRHVRAACTLLGKHKGWEYYRPR